MVGKKEWWETPLLKPVEKGVDEYDFDVVCDGHPEWKSWADKHSEHNESDTHSG